MYFFFDVIAHDDDLGNILFEMKQCMIFFLHIYIFVWGSSIQQDTAANCFHKNSLGHSQQQPKYLSLQTM